MKPEMTYCGVFFRMQGGLGVCCTPEHGACPSCLRSHITRLEDAVAASEEELKDVRDACAWLASVDPDEIKDEELHHAALIDFRRWERASRGPGAVGNPRYSFEEFLIPHAREQGRKAALKEVEGARVVPELPTWEDGESKLQRGEKLTALEKFVMDHDWHKTDTTFRDGLEAVFAELRATHASRVLKDGEERIGAEELAALRKIANEAERIIMADCSNSSWNFGELNALVDNLDTIRAQPTEGGAR